MKKICTYTIVYLMSTLIFYGGSGINIASFCCNSCQSEGITGIVEGACCDIHCHDYEDFDFPKPYIDSDCDTHEAHCSLSRIMYDWNTSSVSTFRYEQYGFDLMKICLPVGLTVHFYVVNDITYEYSTGPPVLSPRAYLSLLTILLI